jgi:hypothetical protein
MFISIGKYANDPCVLVSSLSDFQFRAFDHVSIIVAGKFERHSPEVKGAFKGLVDKYGESLSRTPNDRNEIFTNLSAIIDGVVEYQWHAMDPATFDDERVADVKHALFEKTMTALRSYDGVRIHSENNAWFIITYTVRELLALPVVDSVTTFMLIPLFPYDDQPPMTGWLQISSGTKFEALHVVEVNEDTGKVHGRASFQLGDPSDGIVWYPIMLHVLESNVENGRVGEHKLYVKPEGELMYY